MSIIPFFNEQERTLIDQCRMSTPEYRQEVLRHLEFLLDCMVDEGERDRIKRLLKVLGRETARVTST